MSVTAAISHYNLIPGDRSEMVLYQTIEAMYRKISTKMIEVWGEKAVTKIHLPIDTRYSLDFQIHTTEELKEILIKNFAPKHMDEKNFDEFLKTVNRVLQVPVLDNQAGIDLEMEKKYRK